MSRIIGQPPKPTLAHLLNQHRLNAGRLAKVTQVQLSSIQAMLKGKPVSSVLAEQVLTGFSMLVGVHYHLAEVNVTTWQEGTTNAYQE